MRSDRKTYILDTSVLLADPGAFRRFGQHEVVLPVVAVAELESKRHHPELGWAARRVLRTLEELRVSFGGLGEPVPVNDEGSTLRVELNHGEAAAPGNTRCCPSEGPRRIPATAHRRGAPGAGYIAANTSGTYKASPDVSRPCRWPTGPP
ncbi:MAG: PIN domain-containing protein [Frankiaceae bacterium]